MVTTRGHRQVSRVAWYSQEARRHPNEIDNSARWRGFAPISPSNSGWPVVGRGSRSSQVQGARNAKHGCRSLCFAWAFTSADTRPSNKGMRIELRVKLNVRSNYQTGIGSAVDSKNLKIRQEDVERLLVSLLPVNGRREVKGCNDQRGAESHLNYDMALAASEWLADDR